MRASPPSTPSALLGALTSTLLIAGCATAHPSPSAQAGARTSTTATPPPPEAAAPNPEPSPRPTLSTYRAAWHLDCTPVAGAPSPSVCDIFDVAALPSGDTLVAGQVAGKVRVHGRLVVGRSMPTALLVKVHADGSLAWIRTYGRSWHNAIEHLALGPRGHIFASGVAANGFHPALPRRPDPDHVGDAERPFIGTLNDQGRWVTIRDYGSQIMDLRATPGGGVVVVDRRGRVERLSVDLRSEGVTDYAFASLSSPPKPGESTRGQLRLTAQGGLWRVHDVVGTDRRFELHATYYEGGALKADTGPLLRVGGAYTTHLALDEAGRLALLSDAPAVEDPRERALRWWLVEPSGALLWSRREHYKSRSESPIAAQALGVAFRGDLVVGLVLHADTERVLGSRSQSEASGSNGHPMSTALIERRVSDGAAVSLRLGDACVSASLRGSTTAYRGLGRGTRGLYPIANSRGCGERWDVLYRLELPRAAPER